MNILKSWIIAFAMYSKIPVPQFEWKEKHMSYSMVFFPSIGVVIGFLELLWTFVSLHLEFPVLLYGAVATAIPLVITGGIHMDGFCDTVDALSSYQSKERRLEILKDPHTGAFAIIWTVVYFIVNFGLWAGLGQKLMELEQIPAVSLNFGAVEAWGRWLEEISGWTLWGVSGCQILVCLVVALGFVSSRILSGLAVVTFQGAKKEGILFTFSSAAAKITVRILLIVLLCVVAVLQVLLMPVLGGVSVICQILMYLYYFFMSRKQFGGITGDLAGWFLQCCELISLAVMTVGMCFM